MSAPAPAKSEASRQRSAVLVSAVTTMALLLIGASMLLAPWPVMLALALTMLALVAWLLRRSGPVELVGPLFFYDLVRLARRGRSTLVRCLYGLLLLVGLYVVYADHFPQFDPLAAAFDPGLTLPTD